MSIFRADTVRISPRDFAEFFSNYHREDVFFLKKDSNGDLVFHRTDGPAVEFSNGVKTWWVDGKRHRTDGPAYEGIDGTKEWWIDGKLYTKEEFQEKISKASL